MDIQMWSYYRDKKGFLEAMDDYFKEIFDGDDQLRLARAQIKNSIAAINTRMSELNET